MEKSLDCDEQQLKKIVDNYLTDNPDYIKCWLANNVNLDQAEPWIESLKQMTTKSDQIEQEKTKVKEKVYHEKQDSLSCENEEISSISGDENVTKLPVKDEDDSLLAESYIEMSKHGRNSVTSELFQDILEGTRKSHRPSLNISEADQLSRNELREQLRNLSEEDLLMELIRDISNELDINTLCHKILVNVCILINSDRGSLFLARGSREKRYLVPKLFDVTPSSILEDALQAAEQYSKISPIPFGLGIAGYVAQHKTFINLKNAYEDHRFNKEVDSVTGYRTKSILCLPILNGRGDVIGVAQCINKLPDGSGFSQQDVEDFKKYLTFCGIGIQNAQLFELSVQEYKRNQLLLSLARSIFEENSSLETLINKIMIQAQGLLPCERSRVYLIDIDSQDEKNQNFSSIFESQSGEENATKLMYNETNNSFRSHDIYGKLAHNVLLSGQTSNRNCIKNCDDYMEIDSLDGAFITQQFRGAKSILSIPILNCNGIVIGVAQMINKTNGDLFSDVDISTLEAFSIFCGLGIHKTQMYEKAVKLMAKQKVALEVLSYHASSTIEEAANLIDMKVESVEYYGLMSFDFNDFNLSEMDTCLATLRIFMELTLINRFHIPYKVLCRWLLSVKKNYRPVIYHNWRHSFNVTQTMFAILTIGGMSKIMSELDSLALIVACLCHDLDHRGTNNSFQSKIDSPLATLYSTSTMEHHHFDQCIMILNSEGNNILQELSPEEYKSVINMIESCILSTDLAQYFNKRSKFQELISSGNTDWTGSNKMILAANSSTRC
uniref:Phosphodiesterase n=1 Tax=Tetranychus urticae TaxID=32264 RepID=T1KKV2_TETUR